jgi:hypothetical protein
MVSGVSATGTAVDGRFRRYAGNWSVGRLVTSNDAAFERPPAAASTEIAPGAESPTLQLQETAPEELVVPSQTVVPAD